MEFDLEAFERDVDETLKRGREVFEGKYKDKVNALLALSKEEIDKITPDTTDLQKYDELIEVVKLASKHDIEQAELEKRITKLGKEAVEIAKMVSLFV